MSYTHNHWYKPGAWNAICDVCGFRFKSDKLRKRWDGLMVCKDDFEYDHPQKYIKVYETTQAVPWTRTETTDVSQETCYIYTSRAYAGLSTAGCAQAGLTDFTYEFLLNLKNAGTV